MIDKNELLKILPKLIREDDEVKGAIITALSGVVATKDDIARIIDNFNRRFKEMEEANNKRFEEINKRFEEINKRFEEINKRFEEARKERENIKDSMLILREIVGGLIQKTVDLDKKIDKKTAKLEKDINEGNRKILVYLRSQFERE